MKKLFRILGWSLFSLVLLVAGAAIAVFSLSSARMGRRYDVAATPVPKFTAAADLAEGRRLYVSRGCADCHGDDHAGRVFLNDPAIGTMAGANLTSGKGGIASERSDAEIARAIRHGVGKDGRALIFMPSTDFTLMTDEDTGKLVSYLRTVPARDREFLPPRAGPLGRFLFLIGEIPVFVSAEKIDHAARPLPRMISSVSAEYGKYVAATCTGCHRDDFAGGPIQGAPPGWPPAQPITGKALAKWDEAQFIAVLRTGKRPDGSVTRFPMPWQSLGKLNDTEIKALWKYLQTL